MAAEVSGEPVFARHVAGLPYGHVLVAGAFYASLVEGGLGEGPARENAKPH
jgi:hypothetical protein